MAKKSHAKNESKEQPKTEVAEATKNECKGECFVIMPISDPEDYEDGHFKHVYNDLFKPAIEAAGYKPKRADDDRDASLIQLGILKDLVEMPMAIVDLSTRNPNVLYELGFRQAFDKPTVFVEEEGTNRIFDISGIRTISYSKYLKYHDVVASQKEIEDAILATEKGDGVNSLVKLLSIDKANIPEGTQLDAGTVMDFFEKKIENLESMVRRNNTLLPHPDEVISPPLRDDEFSVPSDLKLRPPLSPAYVNHFLSAGDVRLGRKEYVTMCEQIIRLLTDDNMASADYTRRKLRDHVKALREKKERYEKLI